jgi:hypothetical protein
MVSVAKERRDMLIRSGDIAATVHFATQQGLRTSYHEDCVGSTLIILLKDIGVQDVHFQRAGREIHAS